MNGSLHARSVINSFLASLSGCKIANINTLASAISIKELIIGCYLRQVILQPFFILFNEDVIVVVGVIGCFQRVFFSTI